MEVVERGKVGEWDPMSAEGRWGRVLSDMSPGLRRALRAFVAGSSLPCFVVTMFYVSRAYKRRGQRTKKFVFEDFVLVLPAIFGAINMLAQNAELTRMLGAGNYTLKMAIVGVAVGLAFSYAGTFGGANLPQELFTFGISDPKKVKSAKKREEVRRRALIFAPLLYALIWGVVIAGVNTLMRTAL